MPEGDTIHRAAARLRQALLGHVLTRVELPRLAPPHPATGATVERVEARGKHLLVTTSDGLTIHTHQRMTGSWHVYRPGDPWQRSRRAARVVLAVPGAVVVCFSSPIVEVLDERGLRRHPVLRQLGPDLCDPEADIDEAVTRLATLVPADRTIGEALLDQRVACGVGNVYRCDVLFLHRVHPGTPVADVDDELRRELLTSASALLRANLGATRRTTVEGGGAGSSWVHGRGGDPCRRCGTHIEVLRLGAQARYAYLCPTCQPRAGSAPAAPG